MYVLQDKRGCLVLVNSTRGNLKSLALSLASGRAVCLQGPVGSGKTSLVEHLALLTGTGLKVMDNMCMI
jgi:midasin